MAVSKRKILFKQLIALLMDYLLIRGVWVLLMFFITPPFWIEIFYAAVSFFLLYALVPWFTRGWSPGGRIMKIQLQFLHFKLLLFRFLYMFTLWFIIRMLAFAAVNVSPELFFQFLYILSLLFFLTYTAVLLFICHDKRLFFDRWSDIHIRNY